MLAETGARLGFNLQPHAEFVFPRDQETDHMGIHPQIQPGMFWVGVNFPGGRLGDNRRFNDLLKGKILQDDVDIVIDSLLRAYESGKKDDESLSEFFERAPKADLLAVLPERYR